MSQYSKTALSLGGTKEAVLYFRDVITFIEFPKDDSEEYIREIDDFAYKLLPQVLRNSKFLKARNGWRDTALRLGLARIEGNDGSELASALERHRAELNRMFPGIWGLPCITLKTAMNDSGAGTDLAVSITSLKLIDTEKCSLKQLSEFRKDVTAMQKLRRFRLFVYENYNGKPRDFIEDDILKRIEDYDQAVKNWGFTTASGAITTLLNSTLIAGGIAGSFLTAYYNAPLTAIATTMSATGFAVANMAVSLGQQRFAQKELMANPVSYISYAKEKLEGK